MYGNRIVKERLDFIHLSAEKSAALAIKKIIRPVIALHRFTPGEIPWCSRGVKDFYTVGILVVMSVQHTALIIILGYKLIQCGFFYIFFNLQ